MKPGYFPTFSFKCSHSVQIDMPLFSDDRKHKLYGHTQERGPGLSSAGAEGRERDLMTPPDLESRY